MDIVAIILDVAVFVFFLIFALVGLKKGFLRSLVGIISTVLAVVAAIYCAPHLVKALENGFSVCTNLTNKLAETFSETEGAELMFSTENLQTYVTNLGIPAFLAKLIVNLLGDFENTAGQTVGEVLSSSLSGLIVNAICVVVIFFVVVFLLWLVSKLFTNVLDHIPVLGATNRLLGLLLGVLKALIILYVILMIVGLIPSQTVQSAIDSTVLLKLFRDYNLFTFLMTKVPALNDFVNSFVPAK